MKKSSLLVIGAVAAVGAYFMFKGRIRAPRDIGSGDYALANALAISFLLMWREPVDLGARTSLMQTLDLTSRGISGNAEVVESFMPANIDPNDSEWRIAVQQDILNQINGWSDQLGGVISFADVYEA